MHLKILIFPSILRLIRDGFIFHQKNPCCFAPKKTPLASGRRPAVISLPKTVTSSDIGSAHVPPEMTENSLLKLAGGMAVGTTALMFASSALKKSLKLGQMDRVVWNMESMKSMVYLLYMYIYIYDICI